MKCKGWGWLFGKTDTGIINNNNKQESLKCFALEMRKSVQESWKSLLLLL